MLASTRFLNGLVRQLPKVGMFRQSTMAAARVAETKSVEEHISNEDYEQTLLKNRLKAVGARVQGEANDIKRPLPALAEELGMDLELLQDVVAGTAPLSIGEEVLLKMSDTYPVSKRDLLVDHDDTYYGVKFHSREAWSSSERITYRPDKTGELKAYYAYRDTAFSRSSPFRPEWILELRVVDNNEADNPDLAYNKGHQLLQTTFFIGEVNFCWEQNGKYHTGVMNTGDSNQIAPFVPHTFASRNKEKLGLILAITYGGAVNTAIKDNFLTPAAKLVDAAGDARVPHLRWQARLGRQLQAEVISKEELVSMLVADFSFDLARAKDLVMAEGVPTIEEAAAFGKILSVPAHQLVSEPLTPQQEVVTAYDRDEVARPVPSENPTYLVKKLARNPHQNLVKPINLEVLPGAGPGADLFVSLHTYAYNYGGTRTKLVWGDNFEHSRIMEPDESMTLLPSIPHRFDSVDGKGAKVYIVRVPGSLTDETLSEFSTFAANGRTRTGAETSRWY